MKFRILIAMAVVMFAGPVFAQVAQQDPCVKELFDNDPYKYVVRRGDTLWDLASSRMGDPYDWPLIWQDNKEKIEDPHWIYPGQVLLIIPTSVKHWRKICQLPRTTLGGSEAAGPGGHAGIALSGPGETQVTFSPNRLVGFMSLGEIADVGGTKKKNHRRRHHGNPAG